jgi:RHS repeat-associated protein
VRNLGNSTHADYYHITDALFSTAAMITANGVDPQLVERVRYGAYGETSHRWPGDFNDDGVVDGDDEWMMEMAMAAGGAEIGDHNYDVALDLNRDGMIDEDDFVLFAQSQVKWSFGQEPRLSDPSGPDNVIGFGGYVYNAEAQLYAVRFRWYDPSLGRWIQRDPAGYVDGMGLYEYVGSDPVLLMDPSGLFIGSATEFVLKATPGYGVYSAIKGGIQSGRNVVQRERNVAAVEGRDPNFGVGNMSLRVAQEVTGMHTLASGLVGFDTTTLTDLSRGERVLNVCVGSLQGASIAAGGAFRISGGALSPATTQRQLQAAATRATQLAGPGRGPVHGTKAHSIFEQQVKSLGRNDLHTEVSYRFGQLVPRGTKGSVRVDVAQGPRNAPVSIFDYKTGSATLSARRIQQLRTHVPGGQNISIFELR